MLVANETRAAARTGGVGGMSASPLGRLLARLGPEVDDPDEGESTSGVRV